jgi:spermidine synthase
VTDLSTSAAPLPAPANTIPQGARVTVRERSVLLVSVLIISICALTYELIVATLSSYLLGDSITQFSFTIGFFLFAMGVGALLSRRIKGNELRWFIVVELLTGLFGGFSATILYAVFATQEIYYYTAMITVTLLVGICIGLEIPLLMRIVAHRSELSHALADVLSIDYLGALIASLAFPVLLLPSLGVLLTAFAMGLLNAVVGAVCLYQFRHHLDTLWLRRLTIFTGLVIAAMGIGAVTAGIFTRFFEQQLYQDQIIYRDQSTYQRIIMTRDDNDLRLYLDGNLQFSSRDEHRYHEMLVHPAMTAARRRDHVLILGGGDGLAVREVLKYPDVQTVVLVDLDPAMTDLGRDYTAIRQLNGDALRDPRVTIVNTDAYKYLEQSSTLYSVIIIDLPDPNNESLSKLYTMEFYRLLRQHMGPDSVFITQAASPYFVREAYWTIANTIEATGFKILPLHTYVPSFGDWGFVMASIQQTPRPRVPADMQLRYLTEGVLAAAQVFDPDIARVDTGVNTLNNPILPRHYEQGWRQWD